MTRKCRLSGGILETQWRFVENQQLRSNSQKQVGLKRLIAGVMLTQYVPGVELRAGRDLAHPTTSQQLPDPKCSRAPRRKVIQVFSMSGTLVLWFENVVCGQEFNLKMQFGRHSHFSLFYNLQKTALRRLDVGWHTVGPQMLFVKGGKKSRKEGREEGGREM